MGQYKREINTYRKGSKRSPASPASPAPGACRGSEARVPSVGSTLLTRLQGNTAAPGARVLSCSLGSAQPHRVDPVILGRVQRFFNVARPLLDREITTAWLARTLVRVDRGALLDAPRLGPALRALGFRPLRRRLGSHRRSVWLVPGAPLPRVGRPTAKPLGSGRPQWGETSETPETSAQSFVGFEGRNWRAKEK
jgi:hypothetical protein